MKAKTSKVDPCGTIVKSKDFYIPFVKKNIIQLIKLKDGTVVKGEPMCQNRYLLEIGEYKYWLLQTGELILIDEQSKEVNFSIQDIKDAYDLGRAHERNGSDCTSEIVGNAWLRAEILNKNIKWE
jgi:hypothetical protein